MKKRKHNDNYFKEKVAHTINSNRIVNSASVAHMEITLHALDGMIEGNEEEKKIWLNDYVKEYRKILHHYDQKSFSAEDLHNYLVETYDINISTYNPMQLMNGNKWIDASKVKPTKNDIYLVTTGGQAMLRPYKDGWKKVNGTELKGVLAWQPQPEQYKGEE